MEAEAAASLGSLPQSVPAARMQAVVKRRATAEVTYNLLTQAIAWQTQLLLKNNEQDYLQVAGQRKHTFPHIYPYQSM